MELEKIIKEYAKDDLHRKQGIFASLFILQNKLQTAGDKLDPELTMKQWLLLAMAETFEGPATLTEIGQMMGCSRQNVKKIALTLEKKGFVRLEKKEGDSRAVCLLQDERMKKYAQRVGAMQQEVLTLLFEDFSEEEIEALYQGVRKLYAGISKIEKYVEEEHE